MKKFPEVLPRYQPQDKVVQFVQTLSEHWPGAPDFVFYNDLEGAVQRLAGGDPAVLEQALKLSKARVMKNGLGLMHPLDCLQVLPVNESFAIKRENTAGHGVSSWRLISPAVKAWSRIKLNAMGYLVHSLFEGVVAEQVEAFGKLPAGQEMLLSFAMTEVAIPFAGQLSLGGLELVEAVLVSDEDDVWGTHSALDLAQAKVKRAMKVSAELLPVLARIMDEVPELPALVETVKPDMDQAHGLPPHPPLDWAIWGFLTGRVVAEACASRASQTL